MYGYEYTIIIIIFNHCAPQIWTPSATRALAEQRSAEPPDDDDTEANSEEQSEEESDASTGTSEDDGDETRLHKGRWSGLPYLIEMIMWYYMVLYLFA